MGSPETEPSHDVEAWETLKRKKGEAVVVNRGREMGVPEEELNRFMQEAVDRWTANQQYDLVYRFRKNMPFGTAEEIESAKRQADEWEQSSKTKNSRAEKTEREEEANLIVTISPDATFADLFEAIDLAEEAEGLGELGFESELHDNFDSDTADAVIDMMSDPEIAAKTKVLDFFKERGLSRSEILDSLPVKFKQERKKK